MRIIALCLISAASLVAQNATLSGVIKDPADAAIPHAKVILMNDAMGTKRTTQSNDTGYYSLPALIPGDYRITVEANGFQTASRENLKLDVAQNARVDFRLEVGKVEQSVKVESRGELINSVDGSVSTVIDREFVANLPLNGRSFNSLVELSPGTVTVPVNENSRGQYAINGQRADANYYTVDGVSANLGMGASQAPGQGGSGSTVGASAFGGTNNLVSLDALQEFRILTSTYAPEYGRTPGGQIAVVTRGGANQFHGSAFDYFRNDKLDANDWFNNRAGKPKTASRQNDFGGVLGGPIKKNKTFFFFSIEELRLRLPNTLITDVPSLALRQQAPAALQPYLNMFPLPTAPDSVNTAGKLTGLAQSLNVFSSPTNLNAPSLRIDHTLSDRLQMFGRYDFAPSNGDTRGSGSAANVVTRFDSKLSTVTGGLVAIITPTMTNDFRMNYSRAEGNRHYVMDDFGGAVPLPDSALFPAGYSSADSVVTFRLTTGTQVSESTGILARNISQQYNVVDSFSVVNRSHQFKFGVDWRWLDTNLKNAVFQNIEMFTDTGFVSNVAGTVLSGLGTSILSRNVPSDIQFRSWSTYAQDTWKLGSRLTVTYGFRWDLNTPPSSGGSPFIAVDSISNITAVTPAPAGTEVYHTQFGNFAPRLGIAYQLFKRPKWMTVLRTGIGEFFDTGYGLAINLLGSRVFAANTVLANVPIPLSPSTPLPPLAINPPYSQFTGLDPNLKLPRVWQWNFAVEQSLGGSQSLTATYLGSAGRGLFVPEIFPTVNSSFNNGATFGTNNSTSDYEALQVQFERRWVHGFQGLVSYSFSHAIDTASNDTVPVIHPSNYYFSQNRGDADFDVRHALTAAFVYQIPTPKFGGKAARAILGGWAVDPLVRARTALPIDITNSRSGGAVPTITSRVNYVSGQPLYINDPSVPDGRRFNPLAFTLPTGFAQGTFGRNVIRGFNFNQLDFAAHRVFSLTDRLQLQFRGDFFNIFNHPNFGNPVGTYSTATTFGAATAMLGKSLNGTAGGGFNALYQIGGPRSIQLSMRLTF